MDGGGCGEEEYGGRDHSHPLDSRAVLGQTEGGDGGGCESEGKDLGTGRGTGGEVREPLNRNGVGSALGRPGDPTPDLEVEGTGGGGDCSAGTDPRAMEELLG